MNGSLRIIQVVNVRWFNATAWYGLFLADLQKQAGNEVLVIGLPDTASFIKAEAMGLTPVGIDINTMHPANMYRNYRELARLVREFRPDIVNCHRGEGYFLFSLLKNKIHPFALVRTRGDQREPKGGPINRFLYGTLADAVIATNSRTARNIIQKLHCSPKKMNTIIGGVDREVFRYTAEGREEFRAACGFASEDRVIGILGRFDHVKGQKELIAAVALLKKQLGEGSHPFSAIAQPERIKLLLAGFPTEVSDDDIKAALRANSLEQDAAITGKCADVAACISAMDLGVVASLGSEAIARAALEIMSCGVPLVSTNIGVMPDLLPEEALVEPFNREGKANLEGLSQLLGKGLCDASFRDRLSAANAAKMTTLSAESFYTKTMTVYEKALVRAGAYLK